MYPNDGSNCNNLSYLSIVIIAFFIIFSCWKENRNDCSTYLIFPPFIGYNEEPNFEVKNLEPIDYFLSINIIPEKMNVKV